MAKGISNNRSGPRSFRASAGQMVALRALSGANLGNMVEGDIIPRLLMAHRNDRWIVPNRLERPERSPTRLSSDEILAFAPLPLQQEAAELLDVIEVYLNRGVTVEQVFVDLLAGSARKLGEMWEADECDFVDVTMGVWRLQEVMRIVAMRSPTIQRALHAPPSALFACMPGDQHSFGTLMVEEIFSRAGWESEVLFETKRQNLLDILAKRAFDLVGLTVTNDCPSAELADLVSAIRSVSRNPVVRVIVGGRAINADPDLAVAAGADGTAPDAASAVVLAEQMMAHSRPVLGQV